MMATIENLLKKLDGVKVHAAGTGSIYVYYKELKVRVSDHEPNYSAPDRRSNDKCFYTQDSCGDKFDAYDVVAAVATYLDIEIKGVLKGIMTRHLNEQARLAEMAYKVYLEKKAYMQAYEERKVKEMSDLKPIIESNRGEIEDMILRAEAYGSLGANGDKRRKRTKNFFRQEFAAKFGFEANLSDVRELMSANFF